MSLTSYRAAPSRGSIEIVLRVIAFVRFGGDLLSHDNVAVPSAQWRLTAEFGMGSGVSLTL